MSDFKVNGVDFDDKYAKFEALGLPSSFPPRELWVSGSDSTYGALGLNTISRSFSSPVQVGTLSDWYDISSSPEASHNLAIKTNGTLWAWGRNLTGALGVGGTSPASSPTQVGALSNWYKASPGNLHSLALKTDGTLWSWGKNAVGVLGTNSSASYGGYQVNTPVQVGTLTDWKQISAGAVTSFAIKTNGTLWAWGGGAYGRLGLNDTINRSSPVQVGALTDWKVISAFSAYHCLSVKTDGTLWSWGRNGNGRLGHNNNNLINRSSPTQVGTLNNWYDVSVSRECSFAIKTDGTLWAWGYNSAGQLGLNDRLNRSSPTQVGTLTNWKQVVTNGGVSLAVKTDGTFWAWGTGNGAPWNLALINRSSPVQIGTSTNWYKVAAGAGLFATKFSF